MPVISKITGAPFRFWCQKILPAVYDDSLSYYELLCKVVDYLNKVMEDDINVVNLVNELEEFVNNYFDNLDVQQEINNKLDAMAEDGSLTALIEPYVDTIFTEYKNDLDADIEEYKSAIDGDIIAFKSSVNSALTNQDADISSFKTTVNTQLSQQNTEISSFKTQINNTVDTQTGDISAVQAQMSNFVTAHTSDANTELLDIRVGFDSNVFDSAGDAVRGEDLKLSKALELIAPTNILNKNNLITGYTLSTSTGALSPNTDYCVIDFCRVKPETTYYSYTGLNITERSVEAYFYETTDESTFVSRTSGTSFTVPSNCNYVRFSFANAVWETHGTYLHVTPNQYEVYTPWFAEYYIAPTQPSVTNTINDNVKQITGDIKAKWEWGNMNNTVYPFTYSDSHSRVRISGENRIWLNAGSVVGFTDYTGVKYFIAGVDLQGNVLSQSWLTRDFYIRFDGFYQFVLCKDPEAVFGDMTTLTDKFFIIEAENLKNVSVARNNNMLSIAHQGLSTDSYYYGNNKVESYINAKKHYFDFGETDIAFSSDGVPMCSHDLTFADATTSETVTISQHTAVELQTYDYYGGTIATFDEVVSTCKEIGLGLVIDKVSRCSSEANWNSIFDTVKKYQMQDNVIFCIESESNGTTILDWYSQAKIFYVADTISTEAFNIINNLKTWYHRTKDIDIDVNYSNISDFATAYESLPIGVKLYVWTIDNALYYRRYMKYCAGITSNKISANKLIWK